MKQKSKRWSKNHPKRKYVQLRMNLSIHNHAKSRSKEINVFIGEYYELLTILFEKTLLEAYKNLGYNETEITHLHPLIIKAILSTKPKINKKEITDFIKSNIDNLQTRSCSEFLKHAKITI